MNMSTLHMIQRLARTGDTEQAWRLFEASGLARAADNADALTLKGRLTKDRALKAATNDERAALLEEAQSAYLSAAALRPATYPLINAATLALLAGNREGARRTAVRILSMLESGHHEPETEYWLKATRAEACLLLGKEDQAREALADAVRTAPAAWEDHASTLRHFRLILGTLNLSSEWLDALRPPPSMHFSGAIRLGRDPNDIPQAVEIAIGEFAPRFGFGALAAGSDIIIAETLIRRGAELHIVLPASIDAFRQQSVGHFGSQWIARFDRLLDIAATIETLPDLDEVSEAGIMLATRMAMGLAIRQSRLLETQACALRIGTAETDRPAIKRLDMAWEAQGLAIHRIGVDRTPAPDIPLPAFASKAIIAMPASSPVDTLVAAGGVVEDMHHDYATVSFADPTVAARAAMELAAARPVPIGADYVAFDPSAAGPERLATARLIARAAQPGHILLSRAMALALELESPVFGCESFGNIATTHGEILLSVLTSR